MIEEGRHQPLTREARFAAYPDAIAAALGHARRAASARAYRTGVLLPGERKSIEPMAARLEPAYMQAKRQSLHHVVAQADWDERRCGRRCCRRSSGTGRCATGSSTTAAFPGRARTRWAWRGSIAASWASRTTARWWSASRWPMTT